MRLRRSSAAVGQTLCALDPESGKWISLVEAAKACGSAATEALDGADLVRFLGLSPEARAAWARAVAAYAVKSEGVSSFDTKAFEPRSFRDAGLFVRHIKQATKGFGPVALANGHALQMVFSQLIGKSIRLPRLVGPARKPPFYVGNPFTFVGGGEARWPSHCAWLDYELEVALLLGGSVDAVPTLPDVETTIARHGAFVLINDFSARDTQADELCSVSFGFVKSKSFCTAMAAEVVTADELWAPGDKGPLFEPGLACSVEVNGATWGEGTTGDARVCSLAEYVRFAALDEGLFPGELLGLGTVPNCAGVETGRWLAPGDRVTVACEALGRLTNTIAAPPPGVNFKYYGEDPTTRVSRLKTATKLFAMALFVPPFSAIAFLSGAVAALVWPGPGTSPGLKRIAQAKKSQ